MQLKPSTETAPFTSLLRVRYGECDAQNHQKMPVPDWLREKLLSTVTLPLIHHAGVPA